MKCAYITLLSSRSYLKGVLVLNQSLKRAGCNRFPFICVCSSNLDEDLFNILREEGIRTISLSDSVVNKDRFPLLFEKEHHWQRTFDKLQIWGLTEFDKLVFLDSDMIVMANIDHLFDCPNLSAVEDQDCDPLKYKGLNSGLMVIEPNKSILENLIKTIPQTIEQRGAHIGDQDVIQIFFKEWDMQKNLHLSPVYNLLTWTITHPHIRPFVDRDGMKVVHFVGRPKPWELKENLWQVITQAFLYYRGDRNMFRPYILYKYLLLNYRKLSY